MSAGASTFRLVLEAQTLGTQELEKLQKTLDKFNSTVETTQKKTDSAGKSFDGFADKIKTAFSNPLEAAGGAAENLLRSLGPIGVTASAVGASLVAVGAGLFTIAKNAGDAAEQLQNNATRLGMATKEYALFKRASEEAGLSADSLVATMRGMSKAFSDNTDEGMKGKAALRDLGIAATDMFGRVRPVKDLLLDIADALGDIQDPAQKADLATKILGKAALENLPIMNRELRGTVTELQKLGLGSVDSAKEFDTAMDRMGRSWAKFWNQFKEDASEFVLPWVDRQSSDDLTAKKLAQLRAQRDSVNRQFGVNAVNVNPWGNQLEWSSTPTYSFGMGSAARTEFWANGFFSASDAASQAAGRRQIAAMRAGDLQTALGDARKRMSEAADGYDADAFRAATAEVRRLEAAIESLKTATLKLGDLQVAGPIGAPRMRGSGGKPTLFRSYEQPGPETAYGTFSISQSDIAAANRERTAAYGSMDAAYGAGVASRGVSDQQRMVDLTRQTYEYEARRAGLTLQGVAAIQAETSIRLQGLDVLRSQGQEMDYQLERNRILQDQELKILEIRRQRVEKAKEEGGRLFDAITAGGGGLANYAKGLPMMWGRSIFSNAGGMMSGLSGKLSVTNDPNSFLGKLLAGTPFGADPLKTATEANTLATMQNTAALAAASGMRAGGGLMGGIPIPGLNETWGGIAMPMGSASAGSLPTYGGWGAGPGWTKGASSVGSLAKGLGIAGAAAGGAFGAYSGFKAGGAQGALTGTGSILGSFGAIGMMLGSTITGPIAMGIGLALPLIASLMGDPKKKRQRALESEANARAFSDPTGATYNVDAYGNSYDYNYRGTMRPIIVVNQNISAMDSKSIVDRADDISEAVRRGISSYPPLVPEMRMALNPA